MEPPDSRASQWPLARARSAQGSLGCGGESIRINTGSGAEAPSNATGHEHQTGRHYIKSITSSGLVEWWADNDGGLDGDTADTYYGTSQC